MRARIRTVKPEVFLDEELWALGVETGMPVLQAFIGLWCFADREGRFEWRPLAIRACVLPYWTGDMGALLAALESKRFLVRYDVEGKALGLVRTFTSHQVVNTREAESVLPPPTGMHVHAHEKPVHAHGELEGKGTGREGKGTGKGKPRASAIDPGFTPNASCISLAAEKRVDLSEELPQFIDHYTASGASHLDWQARMRTWIRNQAKWHPRGRHGPANAIHQSGLGTQKQVARVMQFMKEEQESEKK